MDSKSIKTLILSNKYKRTRHILKERSHYSAFNVRTNIVKMRLTENTEPFFYQSLNLVQNV